MCGISGFWCSDGVGEAGAVLRGMASAVRHRGPDDQGYWCDPQSGVGLAHRRLSIIDLSAAGHQPMIHPRSGDQIIFNGEIYNFPLLRRELEK